MTIFAGIVEFERDLILERTRGTRSGQKASRRIWIAARTCFGSGELAQRLVSESPAHALPTRFASVRRQAKNWKQSPSMWELIRSEPRWKRSAKALAVVRPMPEPAPVTRATLFSNDRFMN
jgi:hypothetical protein